MKGTGHPHPYIAAYDVYSIGIVLVELMLGCLNGVRSTRNGSQFLDVFEKYVQEQRTYHRIVDGWKNLMGDADPTVMWNPDALEIACKATIQCMHPFPEELLSTEDLLDKLRDAISLNTNAGIQRPDAASAVDRRSIQSYLQHLSYRDNVQWRRSRAVYDMHPGQTWSRQRKPTFVPYQ